MMKKKYMKAVGKLKPLSYDVCVLKATEPPFSGEYLNNKKTGDYVCAVCGLSLFSSKAKYESGTGWPSFWENLGGDKISLTEDFSHGMVRIEVSCVNCGSHLGHMFTDGPKDLGGKRYCINSAALNFRPKDGK